MKKAADYVTISKEEFNNLLKRRIYTTVTYRILSTKDEIVKYYVRDCDDIIEYTFINDKDNIIMAEAFRIYDMGMSEIVLDWLRRSISKNNDIKFLGMDVNIIDDNVTDDYKEAED